MVNFQQELRNTTYVGLCCSPIEINGCGVCQLDLDGFYCATKKFCIDYYCTNLKTGTAYIINQDMETKYEHQLSTSSTPSIPDTLDSTTNDNYWNEWNYIKLILFCLLFGMLVFFFCFFFLRHTRVCRTIKYCRTSDPENVAQWWCYGKF